MGYSRLRLDNHGKRRYTAYYWDARGRECSAGTFSTKKRADEEWQRAESRVGERRGGDLRRGNVRFERYVEDTWFPNHRMELYTRQNYRRRLDKHILPHFAKMKMREIYPADVREFLTGLDDQGQGADLIASVKTVMSAIFTTALNDEIIFLHPCKGVQAKIVPEREYTIVTPEQFDKLYNALPSELAKLLVETDVESGMRWGELTELRVKDLDFEHNLVTVRRAVADVEPKFRVDDVRFVVKDYPKGRKSRRFMMTTEVMSKLKTYAEANGLTEDDLVFRLPQDDGAAPHDVPEPPDPDTLGRTEPNANGRTYKHGTLTAYTMGACKCDHCRSAFARYRANRRAKGKDDPRAKRVVNSDGHIPRDWWRKHIWLPALEKAKLGTTVRPHDLRHSHASWLLAGGTDLQVVKERMGHGSIRTTERYLHTLPEADESAIAAFTKIRHRNTQKPAQP